MNTNYAAICEHIDAHIEGLSIALEGVDSDDIEQRDLIIGHIAQMKRERELGYVPDECKPWIPCGGE
jgi:hypothetical protein